MIDTIRTIFQNNWFQNVCGGIIATIVFITFSFIKKKIKYRCKYNKYAGYFLSYLEHKNNMENDYVEKEENVPHYIINLKRKENKFIIDGYSITKNGEKFIYRYNSLNSHIEGEIVMNNNTDNFGIGYYRHKDKFKNQRTGYGEYKLILTNDSNSIQVTQIIGNSNDRFLWKRIERKEYDSYKNELKTQAE